MQQQEMQKEAFFPLQRKSQDTEDARRKDGGEERMSEGAWDEAKAYGVWLM